MVDKEGEADCPLGLAVYLHRAARAVCLFCFEAERACRPRMAYDNYVMNVFQHSTHLWCFFFFSILYVDVVVVGDGDVEVWRWLG